MAESILPRDHWPLDSAVLFPSQVSFSLYWRVAVSLSFLLQLLGLIPIICFVLLLYQGASVLLVPLVLTGEGQ